MNHLRVTAVSAILVAAACYGGGANDYADYVEEVADMSPQEIMESMTKPIELNESTMENLVAAMTEMQTLGDKYEAGSDMANMASAWSANSEGMRVLGKHGFKNPMEFQRVVASVAGAMAAVEMEGREEEMAKAQAQMEAMKSQMTEEQYNMLVASSQAALGGISDQPAGNVELVKKWRERLDAIGDN
jgi:hypothetical protein